MKRAFTLIELLVVVGIMAFLGVAATGGYAALQRGMAERSAVAAASSLLRAAKERALVDRSPTAVFFYNRLLTEATDSENAVVVGEAVAVRRAGRITWTDGTYLADEFMDVVGGYDIVDKSEVTDRKGLKLWWFGDDKMSKMQYSIVADAVVPISIGGVYTFEGWGNGEDGGNSSDEDNFRKGNPTKSGNMNHAVYAFYDTKKSSHSATWQVGNGYGFEFATIQLPKNFIFGNNPATQLGQIVEAKAVYFSGDPSNSGESDEEVEVQLCRPDASGLPSNPRKVGTASSKEDQTI